MLIRSLREAADPRQVNGFFTKVSMPVRIAPEFAEDAFLRPLARALHEAELGEIVEHEIELDDAGETAALVITLSLITDASRALERIADMLESLDAPVGSVIGQPDSGEVLSFGKSHGLGLYLPNRDADEEGRIAVAEACTEAMEGSGLYQGSAALGDRTALYFYGDSFNRMRSAITFVMTHDPRCRNAYARRLVED